MKKQFPSVKSGNDIICNMPFFEDLILTCRGEQVS